MCQALSCASQLSLPQHLSPIITSLRRPVHRRIHVPLRKGEKRAGARHYEMIRLPFCSGTSELATLLLHVVCGNHNTPPAHLGRRSSWLAHHKLTWHFHSLQENMSPYPIHSPYHSLLRLRLKTSPLHSQQAPPFEEARAGSREPLAQN